MHKNKGRKQQLRGEKRRLKILTRKQNKLNHTQYLVKLMFKYGINLKLKPKPGVGEKYINDILGIGNAETSV